MRKTSGCRSGGLISPVSATSSRLSVDDDSTHTDHAMLELAANRPGDSKGLCWDGLSTPATKVSPLSSIGIAEAAPTATSSGGAHRRPPKPTGQNALSWLPSIASSSRDVSPTISNPSSTTKVMNPPTTARAHGATYVIQLGRYVSRITSHESTRGRHLCGDGPTESRRSEARNVPHIGRGHRHRLTSTTIEHNLAHGGGKPDHLLALDLRRQGQGVGVSDHLD